MILDMLQDGIERYAAVRPLLGQALRFLLDTDFSALPLGRTPIDGVRLYASLESAPGRRRAEAPLENHRRYIDVHYVLEGEEEIGWKPVRDCVLRRCGYDDARDVEFFGDEPTCWALLRPGAFFVAWPGEAHAPMVSPEWVKKVVVKVALRAMRDDPSAPRRP